MEHLIGFLDLDWLSSQLAQGHGGTFVGLSLLCLLVSFSAGVQVGSRRKQKELEPKFAKAKAELEETRGHLGQMEALYTAIRGCEKRCDMYEPLIMDMLEDVPMYKRLEYQRRTDEIDRLPR